MRLNENREENMKDKMRGEERRGRWDIMTSREKMKGKKRGDEKTDGEKNRREDEK